MKKCPNCGKWTREKIKAMTPVFRKVKVERNFCPYCGCEMK